MKQRIKRRHYPLIHRSHQYRFLAMVLIYNLIIVTLLVVFLFVPDIIRLQDETLTIDVRAEAADKILTMHSRIWPAVLALICVFGLHSFRVFHRFIGPLYRFTMAFEQVRKGDLSFRVTLRKGDYLHQEAIAFNEMIETLSEKIGEARSSGHDALEALQEFEKISNDGNDRKEGDRETFADLRQHIDSHIDTIRYFRFSNGEGEKDE